MLDKASFEVIDWGQPEECMLSLCCMAGLPAACAQVAADRPYGFPGSFICSESSRTDMLRAWQPRAGNDGRDFSTAHCSGGIRQAMHRAWLAACKLCAE